MKPQKRHEKVNEKRMSIRMKVNGDEKFEAKKVFHLLKKKSTADDGNFSLAFFHLFHLLRFIFHLNLFYFLELVSMCG